MRQNTLMTLIIVAAVSIGGGFFAGMKYQQAKRVGVFTQMKP